MNQKTPFNTPRFLTAAEATEFGSLIVYHAAQKIRCLDKNFKSRKPDRLIQLVDELELISVDLLAGQFDLEVAWFHNNDQTSIRAALETWLEKISQLVVQAKLLMRELMEVIDRKEGGPIVRVH